MMDGTYAVRLLPASPRVRRRLGRLVLLLALVGGVVALVVALPRRNPAAPPVPSAAEAATASEPAAQTAAPKRVPLRPADRRAIRTTLLAFVPAAVERKDPAAAWELATPTLRSGMTRAEWAKGDIPVYPYRTRPGGTADGWRVTYSFPGHVSLDLVLPPAKGSKQGPIAFTVDLERVRGRWLVDAFVPTATFAPIGATPRITAQADFAPATTAVDHRGRLNALWLALPAGVLSLIVGVPFAFFVLSWLRDRRALRAYYGHLGSES